MAKYFTLDELTRSNTAAINNIDNAPTGVDTRQALEALMTHLLDPARELWGAPIVVTSGYRCPRLNRAVGGAVRSQHLVGEAADITAGSRSDNKRLFERIVSSGLAFDQLIDERGYSWLHLSYRKGGNRNQILHLK